MSDSGLNFLYNNSIGRLILGILTRPGLSRACGRFMDSSLSRFMIKGFIRRNGIDMTDYEEGPFFCFNDFFTRRIKEGRREFPAGGDILASPCDGLLSVYEIKGDTVFPVKQSRYDVHSLLGDRALSEEFIDGTCLIFRLCVDNYHRYSFMDSGRVLSTKKIQGKLHTVRPVALEKEPVFIENTREYAYLETDNFGRVVQMEVGAMLVGKISNHDISDFKRGDEKGCFLYGGSTIILLLKKGAAVIDDVILDNSEKGVETAVIMGQKIGRRA